MKIRILLFLTLLCLPAKAIDLVTATITVTNTAGTTNGQTITVNGVTRTWTNSVVVPSAQILTNNTIGGSATNMFTQIAGNPYAGLALNRSGTNGITLQTAPGGSVTVTFSVGWGLVVYTTNTLTSAVAVRVPYTVESAGQQTNIPSGVVAMLNASGNTNAINDFVFAASNLVGLHTTQTVAGAKSMTNQFNLYAGNINGAFSTNLTETAKITMGGYFIRPIGTFGIGFVDIGSGDTNLYMTNSSVVINSAPFINSGSALLNQALLASATGQAQWGYVPGITNAAIRGAYFDGTNTFPAGSDVAFGRFALTTLATGANAAIPVGTNIVVEVSGPGGAFSINGIAGGRDGKFLILLNQTGFNMTLAHENGGDPTPANRIHSLTGADQATTGDGAAILWYSGASSRWVILQLQP